MTSQEKNIVLNEIVDKYKKQADVIGVLAFGSFVRGNFDLYSDIDIYVLTAKKPSYVREGYTLQNTRVDVTLDEEQEAYEFLKREGHSVRRIFSHMLANGHILYEKKSALKKVQQLAKKNLEGKTIYNNDELLMHLYSIDDFYGEVLRFSKTKDTFSFEQSVVLLINNTIECLLKIKGEYLRRPNELREIIKKSDLTFWRSLEAVYHSKNNLNKVRNLGKLVRRIETLAKGPLPDHWKIR
jgi:predicted nucleotidyltransferase